MNLLLTEWKTRSSELAVQASRMFPMVDVEARTYGVSLTTFAASGEVVWAPRTGESGPIRFRLTSSSCVSSNGISALSAHANALKALADAGAWFEHQTEDMIVWFQDAPCDSCSGMGTSCGWPCKRCGGAGKRNRAAE